MTGTSAYVVIRDRCCQYNGQRFRVRARLTSGAVQVIIAPMVFMWFEPGEYAVAGAS
jgi:hypothetical protein